MIRTLPPIVPFWHEPANQETDPKAKFRLRGLTGLERIELLSAPATSRYRVLLQYGVIGFENIFDHDGNAIPSNKPIIAVIESLPDSVTLDITNKIAEATSFEMNEPAKKN